MQISSATQSPVTMVTPQEVGPAVLKRATGDGDGRTGAAALNDGDSAAQAAARSVKASGNNVDVRL